MKIGNLESQPHLKEKQRKVDELRSWFQKCSTQLTDIETKLQDARKRRHISETERQEKQRDKTRLSLATDRLKVAHLLKKRKTYLKMEMKRLGTSESACLRLASNFDQASLQTQLQNLKTKLHECRKKVTGLLEEEKDWNTKIVDYEREHDRAFDLQQKAHVKLLSAEESLEQVSSILRTDQETAKALEAEVQRLGNILGSLESEALTSLAEAEKCASLIGIKPESCTVREKLMHMVEEGVVDKASSAYKWSLEQEQQTEEEEQSAVTRNLSIHRRIEALSRQIFILSSSEAITKSWFQKFLRFFMVTGDMTFDHEWRNYKLKPTSRLTQNYGAYYGIKEAFAAFV